MSSPMTRQHFDSELVRCQPILRTAARGLCARQPNADDTAQDLLQATCVHAIERHEQFCGGSVVGWLYALMRNLFHDSTRKLGRARKREVLQADLPRVQDRDDVAEYDAFPDTQDPHATLEMSQIVRTIDRMPDRTKSALFEAGKGATSSEIAASLGLTEAHARKLLERGRLTLRLTLGCPLVR
ncbi:RNA polymerase sigma factor (sigma-70 family) [Bradyrhizobium sp. JR4.1]|uniref:RNA polymerase sigma factor n=1 Tax=Bradyrhizobium sp. JR4.1 TaxID=3156372 RepID=UPI00339B09A9